MGGGFHDKSSRETLSVLMHLNRPFLSQIVIGQAQMFGAMCHDSVYDLNSACIQRNNYTECCMLSGRGNPGTSPVFALYKQLSSANACSAVLRKCPAVKHPHDNGTLLIGALHIARRSPGPQETFEHDESKSMPTHAIISWHVFTMNLGIIISTLHPNSLHVQ